VVEQQGVIADRPERASGVSDGGIIAMRQMMREALAAVAEGKDPALHHPRQGAAARRLPAEIVDDGAKQVDPNYGLGFTAANRDKLVQA